MQDWKDSFTVQNLLYLLNEDNLEESAKKISRLEISKSIQGLFRLANAVALFFKANVIKGHLYAELIDMLENKYSYGTYLDDLSTIMLRYLINFNHPINDNSSNKFGILLAHMIEKGLLTIEDIYSEINYNTKDLYFLSKNYSALLSYAKEAGDEMFRMFALKNYSKESEEEFYKLETDIDYWKDYAKYGTFRDTVERYIQEDDNDALVMYFAMGFKEKSKMDKYVKQAAKCGAIKCFKYFILNNQVTYDEYVAIAAIKGGNFEIIHLVQNSYDGVLETSENIINAIKSCRNEVFLWLLNSTTEKLMGPFEVAAICGNIVAFHEIVKRVDKFRYIPNGSLDYFVYAKQNNKIIEGDSVMYNSHKRNKDLFT